MTVSNCLSIIAIALMVLGWGAFARAEADAATGAASTIALAPDGTPVVHKSLHKKKKTTATATTVSAPITEDPTVVGAPKPSSTVVISPKPADTVLTVTAKPSLAGAGPVVETGMPVARHSELNGGTISGGLPAGLQDPNGYRAAVASNMGMSNPETAVSSTAIGGYTSTSRTGTAIGNFTFTDYSSRRPKNNYPWKTGIYTTMFFIGEGPSSISSTTNMGSSWDADWVSSNRGSDNPDDRNGYASGSHALTVNPFYVALPFNDLVCIDKAREWLPAGWHRPNKDGKPVSACKDRWVEIKVEDGSGHVCYAQWEDVGPLRYDHAEYVFGPERPDTLTRAGLDVSPAVYEYLGMKEMKHPMTRWRFVDDEDVPPGQWLKLDEQAVIYQAMHHPSANIAPSLPIQRASQPIDDGSDTDTNKKRVGAAKG